MEHKHPGQRPRSRTRGEPSLASFLDAHLGRVESDDVGPTIGHAAFMNERGSAALTMPNGSRAGINAALSGDASRPSMHARGRRLHAVKSTGSR